MHNIHTFTAGGKRYAWKDVIGLDNSNSQFACAIMKYPDGSTEKIPFNKGNLLAWEPRWNEYLDYMAKNAGTGK